MTATTPRTPTATVNVANRLAEFARLMPDAPAVIVQRRRRFGLGYRYERVTFAEFAADIDQIARGLRQLGIPPGTRLALLVKPSVEFVALVFAMLKAGIVIVLIDPGMGRKNLVRCLAESEPEGFVAIPLAMAASKIYRRHFPKVRWNITVGRCYGWGGATLDEVRASGRRLDTSAAADEGPWTGVDDPTAIIFTTGSTGPPKGVLCTHGNFDRQVEEIRDQYAITPGEVNLACFPLFGLFNAAMGVTTVIPDMDASRPAKVNPANIVAAVRDCGVTQSFASPAVWNVVGLHCERHRIRLPSLREAYSAGAPVPPKVIERMTRVLADGGRLHTPYGATEALPIATIASPEILGETALAWAAGKGTCVGKRFPGINWRIIRIVDGPIASIDETEPLPPGEIGELIVRGPVVTRRYVTRVEANAGAKIADGDTTWHRMGDTGYLDDQDRFWFCGRVAHRVTTERGTLFTDPVEGVMNQFKSDEHGPFIRSALVGVGPPGKQRPVLVFEILRLMAWKRGCPDYRRLLLEYASQHPATAMIEEILDHHSFPVDVRHNSKIIREELAAWAAEQLAVGESAAS
jgi:acyl-CoA synthetase (AMP-forming)/AMP-acid ligase II